MTIEFSSIDGSSEGEEVSVGLPWMEVERRVLKPVSGVSVTNRVVYQKQNQQTRLHLKIQEK